MIPTGTFIRTDNGVFYIKNNKRFRVLTQAILDSWTPPRVVQIEERLVQHLPIVGKLRFRDGTLVYSVSSGKIYLIAGQEKHRLVGGETLRLLGLGITDAIPVSEQELDTTPEGEEYK